MYDVLTRSRGNERISIFGAWIRDGAVGTLHIHVTFQQTDYNFAHHLFWNLFPTYASLKPFTGFLHAHPFRFLHWFTLFGHTIAKCLQIPYEKIFFFFIKQHEKKRKKCTRSHRLSSFQCEPVHTFLFSLPWPSLRFPSELAFLILLR